jgi:LPXTG-motif cell wall-anchored protein
MGTASQLIFPRAKISLTEVSVSQRILYNKIGLYLIAFHPLGVGLSNQAIYSVKNGLYQDFGMNQVWQWQPIHNIYLLIGSEIGILGLIVFLILVAWILINLAKGLIKNTNSKNNNLLLIAGLMFLSLLGFGFFDHFLWTLQPGRLMFWLVLGIILGLKGRKHLPS